MKKTLSKIIIFLAKIFFDILNIVPGGKIFLDAILSKIQESTLCINYKNSNFKFSTPNKLNYFRAQTFSTKEPETLDWIDTIPRGNIFWDIGANIGSYSIYAAKKRDCRVYAFEPSVFNLELLARNIYINKLVDKITIMPFPLSDVLKKSTLNMSSTELGGALSTFSESYGDNGKPLKAIFEFSTLGLSIIDVIESLKIPIPNYMKIDVDGIEQLILKGGGDKLKAIKEILVEVNDDFDEQREKVQEILLAANFVLKEKKQSEMIGNSDRFGNTYNQIWCKK